MSRDVTNTFIAACNAATTDECFVLLIRIEHPDFPVPILLNTSGWDIISNGDYYQPCPVQVTLSEDSSDRPPQAKLVVDNIDRTPVAAVRSITSPPIVDLSVVRASAPDVVEASFPGFEMRKVDYSTLTIEGTLTLDNLYSEPSCAYSFTPAYFPGLKF